MTRARLQRNRGQTWVTFTKIFTRFRSSAPAIVGYLCLEDTVWKPLLCFARHLLTTVTGGICKSGIDDIVYTKYNWTISPLLCDYEFFMVLYSDFWQIHYFHLLIYILRCLSTLHCLSFKLLYYNNGELHFLSITQLKALYWLTLLLWKCGVFCLSLTCE